MGFFGNLGIYKRREADVTLLKKRQQIASLEESIKNVRAELQDAKFDSWTHLRQQREEIRKLKRQLRSRAVQLQKLGKRAKTHMGFYAYSSFMRMGRVFGQTTGAVKRLMPSQDLITDITNDRPPPVEATGGGGAIVPYTKRGRASLPPTENQIVPAHTALGFFTKNVFVFGLQMFAAAFLEVKLLRMMHLLMILKVQQDLHRKGWNDLILFLLKYTTEEVESELMRELYQLQASMTKLREDYEKRLKIQRKLKNKLKMMEAQQLSNKSLSRYSKWVKDKPPAFSPTEQGANASITSAPPTIRSRLPSRLAARSRTIDMAGVITETFEEEKGPHQEKKTDSVLVERLQEAEDRFGLWREDSEQRLTQSRQKSIAFAEQRLKVWRMKSEEKLNQAKQRSMSNSMRLQESRKRVDSFISVQSNIRRHALEKVPAPSNKSQ